MPSISQISKGQSDAKLKEAGVWATIIVPDVVDPLKLKLRSAASNAVRMWEIKRYREQRNYYLNDNLPPIEVIDQNEIDKLADVMVMDWNVTDDAGAPSPCDADAVRAMMTIWPDVRRDALAEAAKHANYRHAEVAVIAKNSVRPSSTHSVTVAEGA
jgi:hypothetical protein